MKSELTQLCRSYVRAHSAMPFADEEEAPKRVLASITLSRQAGARGRSIATELADHLNARQTPGAVPWTVFDRDLMEQVLADHDLPRELARFFPEAHWSELDGTINALLRRHPDNWTIFEHTVDTIRRLGRLGHAILVGRGANFITRGLPNVLHLRLVGDRGGRLAHLREGRHWSEAMARAYLEHEDRNRRAFVRQHFSADIDDPLAYTMILNTDLLDNAVVVQMVAAWVRAQEAPPVAGRGQTTRSVPQSASRALSSPRR